MDVRRSGLEKPAIDGYSPVVENRSGSRGTLSRAGHVKPCLKSGGPPSKANYERMTDGDELPWGKGESTPGGAVK
jgi:hypothetical protein